MGLEIRVDGMGELLAFRRKLKTLEANGLGKTIGAELRKVAGPLATAIRAEVPGAMPSGYEGALSGSLRFPTRASSSKLAALVTVRVYGDGRRERRDIPALNRGVLRHPVHGRKRRAKYRFDAGRRVRIPGGQLIPNPWVRQQVRRGFIDRPADRLGPELDRRMNAVVDEAIRQLS